MIDAMTHSKTHEIMTLYPIPPTCVHFYYCSKNLLMNKDFIINAVGKKKGGGEPLSCLDRNLSFRIASATRTVGRLPFGLIWNIFLLILRTVNILWNGLRSINILRHCQFAECVSCKEQIARKSKVTLLSDVTLKVRHVEWWLLECNRCALTSLEGIPFQQAQHFLSCLSSPIFQNLTIIVWTPLATNVFRSSFVELKVWRWTA